MERFIKIKVIDMEDDIDLQIECNVELDATIKFLTILAHNTFSLNGIKDNVEVAEMSWEECNGKDFEIDLVIIDSNENLINSLTLEQASQILYSQYMYFESKGEVVE
jgi:hypothetical protein